MTAPLPAMVDGPVYAVPNVHISAGNVLPDALVTISQNGLEVAQSASASAGMICGSAAAALAPGGKTTATQTYPGTRTTCMQHLARPVSPCPFRSPVWQVTEQLLCLTWQPHLRGYQYLTRSAYGGRRYSGSHRLMSANV